MRLDLKIDGRKYCFSIFFQWLQSIKSFHSAGGKITNIFIMNNKFEAGILNSGHSSFAIRLSLFVIRH
jgi:hypothetical protein